MIAATAAGVFVAAAAVDAGSATVTSGVAAADTVLDA